MPSLLLFAALVPAAARGEPPRLRATWAGPEMTVTLVGGQGCAVLRSPDGVGVEYARAASDLRVVDGHLWIAQDDSAFVAVSPLASGQGRLWMLFPRLAARFGHAEVPKPLKADPEILVPLDTKSGPRLLAMGSGSTPGRYRVALIEPFEGGSVREVALTGMYRALDARKELIGTDLNLEGAANLGDILRLFQRGNGAVRDGRVPHNAIVDLDMPGFLAYLEQALDDPRAPFDERLVRYAAVLDLAEIHGGRLTFSGACELGGGWSVYVAAAERSPDAYSDGEIAGSAVGLIDREGRAFQTSLVLPDEALPASRATPSSLNAGAPPLHPLAPSGGSPALKLEGVAIAASGPGGLELRLCADQDLPGHPSPILRARLIGPLVTRALAAAGR